MNLARNVSDFYHGFGGFPFNTYGKVLFFILIAINIFFSSWYALHGDLSFNTDISRDFLLFHEIEEKQLMLIGARTGGAGIYHGVFWYYLMFPVYFLSNGDPVAVSWFWVILSVAFLGFAFVAVKRIFNRKTAYLFCLAISGYLVFETKSFSHPQGGMLLMLFFFYAFWQYVATYKVRFLAAAVVICGLLIHLELVTGIPITILAFSYLLIFFWRKNKRAHAFALLLIFIPLSTYIAFELRHDFLQIRSVLHYIGEGQGFVTNLGGVIVNRLDYMTNLGLPLVGDTLANRVVAVFFFIYSIHSIIRGVHRKIYLTYLYFFVGFYLISTLSPYDLLRHHVLAFIPVTLMIFASLVVSRYGKPLLLIFLLVICINEFKIVGHVRVANDHFGKSEESWLAMKNVGENIFQGNENEFGYFVNSPDILGYGPKYAMIYSQKRHGTKKAYYFSKKRITYVISTPLPKYNNFFPEGWIEAWPRNAIEIRRDPQSVEDFPNGFKVFRFRLSDKDIAVPFNQNLDAGLHYR